MTTTADLISRTRNDYLSPSKAENRNKLAADITSSDETLTFARPLNGIAMGSKISIGLEDIHVWSTDDGAKTADVDRGEYGTTAASASTGDVVLVNPLYTDSQILRGLNSAVSMLVSEGIIGTTSFEFTYNSSVRGYDIVGSSRFLDLIDVHWESTDTAAKAWRRVGNVRVLRGANAADFASGTAMFIDWAIPHGATIRVTYSHELDGSLASLTDVVETVTGIDPAAVDLLCIGAALTLTAGKEIALNETSSARPRRSGDTPPGSFSQADSNLESLWRSRVRAERGRQNRRLGRFRVREFS